VGEEMKIKIFEGETLIAPLEKCLEEGYIPAPLKEVYDLKEQEKIPCSWYNTSTLYFQGNIRNATLKQLQNIKDIYNKGGCLLYVGILFAGDDYVCSGHFGDYGLNYYGRFVGVKK